MSGCEQTPKHVGQPITGKIPDSILEDATIAISSAGLRRAVIKADTMYIFEKEDSSTVIDVKVDFYNESGQYQSTLIADRGLVRQKQESFSVWGDVVAFNDSSRIETQSLDWDSKRNLITTEDFVRLERRDDVITGVGLEADSKLENIRILRDVKGRITDVPQSEGELDSLDKSGMENDKPQ